MKKSFTRREMLKAATAATISAGAVTNDGSTLILANQPLYSAAGPVGAPRPETNLPWYRRLMVGMEIGPTGANDKDQIFYSRVTGKEVVENLVRVPSCRL